MIDLSKLHFCVDCRFYYHYCGSQERCTATRVVKWDYHKTHVAMPDMPVRKNCDNDCADYEPRLLKRLANIWRKAVKP